MSDQVNLKHLVIEIEKQGSTLQFGKERTIVAMFNPNHLKFSRTAGWTVKSALRDTPEFQFTGSQPRTVALELLFDTYDSDKTSANKDKVTDRTDELLKLTMAEDHPDKHRPPVCRLSWGGAGVFFQGVMTQMEQDLILFTEYGVPVRAKVSCTFLEWRTNYADLKANDPESSDVAKVRVVQRGDTLASIAAAEYRDPAAWRTIANANDIDDPLRLTPGRSLMLPSTARSDTA